LSIEEALSRDIVVAVMPSQPTLHDYIISSDRDMLQIAVIHGYLTESYWAEGIPLQTVARSIEHSMCFGVYVKHSNAQVGFARVVTDYATFMYLADVFILPDHRGIGLGVALTEHVVNEPSLQGLRTSALLTKDAHDLYRKFGFINHPDPNRFMIRKVPHPYPRKSDPK
jgi:GNAT superfamily N-acetyltransferase